MLMNRKKEDGDVVIRVSRDMFASTHPIYVKQTEWTEYTSENRTEYLLSILIDQNVEFWICDGKHNRNPRDV